MRFYEALERMESAVEKPNEGETKILYDEINTIDDFYERCEYIKSTVRALKQLEMIGEDITGAMQIEEKMFYSLVQEVKDKFYLSDEQIKEIENDIFDTKGRKIR